MSQENVELVVRLHEVFARTRRSVPELLAPEFVWDMSTFEGWPDDPEYAGPEGFDRFFAAWVAPWEGWELKLEEIRDVGPDVVLAVLRQHGTREGSRSPVELSYATVFTIKEGLVSRARVYASPAEALEAAGLSE